MQRGRARCRGGRSRGAMATASRLTSGTTLACVALFAAGGGGGGGGGGGAPPPAFRVVATDPADNRVDVAVDASIHVTFSEAVDPTSVNAQAIRVGAVGGGEVTGTLALS